MLVSLVIVPSPPSLLSLCLPLYCHVTSHCLKSPLSLPPLSFSCAPTLYILLLQVTLHDHSSCTARVVGVDASKDVAVLKLALPRGRVEALCPVKLSTTPLRVGQSVAAIGNPWGLDSTMSMVRFSLLNFPCLRPCTGMTVFLQQSVLT
jgi:Trypsin-like peptidase domain